MTRNKETLKVCAHCLAGIEAHEGKQLTRAIYLDPDCTSEERRCDWCDEEFDTLYEFL